MSANFDDLSAPLPSRVSAGLAKIALVLRHHAWEQRGQHGLTPTQAQVLTLLHSRGPMRLSAVGHELAVRHPTASDAVGALTRKGLVAKQPDPNDGRAVALVPTGDGRDEARRLAEWPDVLQGAIADLPDDEQAQFLRALIKMVRSLQQRGAIPVQRMCVACRYFRPNAYPGADTPHHCAFVDAPFGDRHLRLDCPDHEAADPATAAVLWNVFTDDTRNPEETP